MASSHVPTPELLATDAHGTHAGAPALLMSILEGRPRWDAKGRRYWAHDLADLAATIHAHRPDDPSPFRTYRPYRQDAYDPPRWAADPDLWARAVTIFHEPPPPGRTFIHRDLYPGNLLWRRRRLTGVVDWEHACLGPPDVDVGHCRINFLYQTPDLADHLADAWHEVTGAPYDPWADIAAIIGLLDGLRRHPPSSRARHSIEEALGRAVVELASR
jgi:aminoglycoside phosphotransferase (APT) family kinase protein